MPVAAVGLTGVACTGYNGRHHESPWPSGWTVAFCGETSELMPYASFHGPETDPGEHHADADVDLEVAEQSPDPDDRPVWDPADELDYEWTG